MLEIGASDRANLLRSKMHSLKKLIFTGGYFRNHDANWEMPKWEDEGPVTLESGIKAVDLSSKKLSPAGAVLVSAWIMSGRDQVVSSHEEITRENLFTFHKKHAPDIAGSEEKLLKQYTLEQLIRFSVDGFGEAPLVTTVNRSQGLCDLNISWNEIQSEIAGEHLGAMLQANTPLQRLNVSSNSKFLSQRDPKFGRGLFSGLSMNKTLCVLNVSNNYLGADGANALASALHQNSTLKELNVSQNKMGAFHTKDAPELTRLLSAIANNGGFICTDGNNSYYKEAKCAEGHTLKQFQTPHSGFCCDTCKTYLPQGANLFGCRTCDFDVCVECISNAEFCSAGLLTEDKCVHCNKLKAEHTRKGGLTLLNIMGNQLLNKHVSELKMIMQAKPNLQSVCGIADNATEVLSALDDVGMNARDALVLASELPRKSTMTRLVLRSNSGIGLSLLPEGWSDKNRETEYLYTHLDGRAQKIHPGQPEGLIALFAALNRLQGLTELFLSFCSIDGRTQHTSGPSKIECIAQALRENVSSAHHCFACSCF
jgi:hypothetical protein